MSTSILYHGFGIHGYRYVNSKYQQGAISFTIDKEDHALRCPPFVMAGMSVAEVES